MVDKILSFIEEAQDVLINKTPKLVQYENIIKEELNQCFISESACKNLLIQTRIKKASSLGEKIIRKNYYSKFSGDANELINNLPDLIGVRLVCPFLSQENEMKIELKRIFKYSITHEGRQFQIVKNDSYPQIAINIKDDVDKMENGKEIHKYEGIFFENSTTFINIEIQIKSLINMFWSEIEHSKFYKNYSIQMNSVFYKELMDSVYSSLEVVDRQLKMIDSKLEGSSEYTVDEPIEMLSKMTQSSFDLFFSKNMFGNERMKIDTREAYELLVQLEYKGIDGFQAPSWRKLQLH